MALRLLRYFRSILLASSPPRIFGEGIDPDGDLFFFSAKAGLSINAVSGFAALVWPPTGIALAALVIFGYRLWPGVFLAAFFVNYMAGAPYLGAVLIAVGNSLEALVGAYLLRKCGFKDTLEHVGSAILFILLAGLTCTLISATIGVASLRGLGVVDNEAALTTWVAWWVGDILGALVVGGFLLNLAYGSPLKKTVSRLAEGIMLFSLLFVFNFAIFANLFGFQEAFRGKTISLYLLFPLLIWAALRFRARGASLALLITSGISVWATVTGQGPFTADVVSRNLLMLQMFIGTTTATVMVLAAAISEYQALNRELSEQKQRVEAILRSIGEGVVVLDTRGRILAVNRAGETMLGIRAIDAIGVRFEDVVLVQDENEAPLQPENDPLHQVLSSEKPEAWSGTKYFLPRRGIRFPVMLTVAPVFQNGKPIGAVKVFRDFSREKESDRWKSESISIVSHQLWSPLASARWYCDVLLADEKESLSDAQRTHILDISQTVGRMTELVTALLNVSRIELGTFSIRSEPVNIREVVREVRMDLTHDIQEKHMDVKEEFSDGPLMMKGDRRLLRIVLQNLLSNGIRYSREGSTVGIEVEERDEQGWLMRISDAGYGIPPEEQGKIFTKLFRASNAQEISADGNGLGLYIVKSIVEGAGGRIWFESVPGATTFFVSFQKFGMRPRIGDRELYQGSSVIS